MLHNRHHPHGYVCDCDPVHSEHENYTTQQSCSHGRLGSYINDERNHLRCLEGIPLSQHLSWNKYAQICSPNMRLVSEC